jgi:hypothetical protein
MLTRLDSDDPALRDPGPALVRRLSRTEYQYALRDLTGVTFDLKRELALPEDSTGTSYENIAQALQISPFLMDKYFAAADLVVERLFPAPEVKEPPGGEEKHRFKNGKEAGAALLKEVAVDRAGAEALLTKLQRRAWRRPVSTAETARLMKLYDAATAAGDAFPQAIGKALRPVLVSPHFLFRIEQDQTPQHSATAKVAARVTDVELASRLSFFLWSSLPDEELLSTAEKGELSQPAALDAQVKRMLADAKAKAFTDNFLARWLQLSHLNEARPSSEFFPAFTWDMRNAMREEVEIFCNKLRENDGSILDFLNADYTYANEMLARHYKLSSSAGKGFEKVALKREDHRGGILGMAAILTMTSHTNRTAPTLRGKYVLDVVFGTPPAPPPANVSQIDEKKKGKNGQGPVTFREKLALHAEDATCAGCHAKLDPLGFGLENYDAIGAFRPSGGEVDTSAELPGGLKFDGVAELKKILWERRAQFVRNVISQTLGYALGRELEYFDQRPVVEIQQALEQKEHRFSELILGVVRSYPFQHRRNAEPLEEIETSKTVAVK